MRLNAKVWPLSTPHPAFPKEAFDWAWVTHVKLIYQNYRPTAWFEAHIDSGSPWCLFHSSFCKSLGINLESGIRDELGGVIGGASAPMYFHKVKILIGSTIFETVAGFSSALVVAGILGRHGFFDNFTVTFDPSEYPPQIDLTRLQRV